MPLKAGTNYSYFNLSPVPYPELGGGGDDRCSLVPGLSLVLGSVG